MASALLEPDSSTADGSNLLVTAAPSMLSPRSWEQADLLEDVADPRRSSVRSSCARSDRRS
jgi:hypothetical protein